MKSFKPISKLGEGAFGLVYKVLRLDDNKQYALKQIKMGKLSEKEKNNALNEVRILASINHPHVIGYRDSFYNQDTETLNIVMDYASKGDISRQIQKCKKDKTIIPEEDIWKALVHACRGLKCLHLQNIVHRDLKGANIFINQQGNFILGDLNISKLLKSGMAETQIGTPYYASPQIWQDIPYDEKSDMWSLGCVLYQMAALQPPFRGKDMGALSRKVRAGIYSRIPEIYSKQLSIIIGSLLKVSPHLRPSSIQLLEHSYVKKNYISLDSDVYYNSGTMLSTITFNQQNPRDIIRDLPKANYDERPSLKLNFSRKRIKTVQNQKQNNSFDKQEKYKPKYRHVQDYTDRSYQSPYIQKLKIRDSRVPSNALKLVPRPNISNRVEKRQRSPTMIPQSPRNSKYDQNQQCLYKEYLASRDRKNSNDVIVGRRYIVHRGSLNKQY